MTAAAGTPRITTAQSDYVEHCAGCHGISGSSAPAPVPELRDRVGYFMCNGEARDYLIRLPNVAHAPIRDSGELADLMNFVVFSIGGKSVPDGAQPYQAEEVARLRAEPLRPGAALLARRRQLVGDLIRTCDAPADLQEFYAGQAPESREQQDSRAGA
ncbi:c-type cytochrome [Novosphingobium beihaiensis]|uniref:Cytochrome C n=1 Tax=Novosphingobium beihaiensis TaxID=2930389 RepID=A0ABT0BLB5_9SPHN|nr:cytochrome C [Novosphingobium beihaiensis]MCJ2185829.1 cytochrome C [Novosphingobium beihaiensis]